MFPRQFMAIRLLVALLVIGLLLGAGSMVYHAGQAQGYAFGLYAAQAKDGAQNLLPPGMMAGYPGYGFRMGHSSFGPLAGLFMIGALVVLFFILVRAPFHHWAWRHSQGAPNGPKGPHGSHGWEGGPHSWWCTPPWEQQPPEQPERKEPPAEDKPERNT